MSGIPDAAKLCASADYFPVHIDWDTQSIVFAETREDLIRNASFLDGRVTLSSGPERYALSIANALAWLAEQQEQVPDRLIAHMSFCGSTLLANTLDRAGGCLAYREPQILVELATLKARYGADSDAQRIWQGLYSFILGQLRKGWSAEPTLIKPSNWVNTALGDMSAASSDLRAVVITIGLEAYLIANLRGGKPRLTYSLNLLNHFLSSSDAHRGRVLEVERAGLSPIQRLLRLLVVVYETQDALLRRDLPDALRLSKADLQADLFGAARLAAAELQLTPDMSALRSEIRRSRTVHAKDAGLAFSLAEEEAQDRQVLNQFADDIDEAMDWGADIARSVA